MQLRRRREGVRLPMAEPTKGGRLDAVDRRADERGVAELERGTARKRDEFRQRGKEEVMGFIEYLITCENDPRMAAGGDHRRPLRQLPQAQQKLQQRMRRHGRQDPHQIPANDGNHLLA
ncbi:hypothetical protein B296_00010618 [Ensete ventricosum]|uniref:Uncharacterized protein n=1 Tax=Ensete ventricosum TaxID=4639 RepID=A0A426ZIX0_ENSVE|nr:hypothetical protein B296_00010618 [Ensete ventricosum]